jgi:hypothetical protein
MIDTSAAPSTTASKKWLRLLLLVIACVGVLIIAGTANDTPPPIQRPADREAESFASRYLLSQLNAAAGGPDDADRDRASRVEALLQSMTGERVIGSYESILVGPRNGERFPVAVYSYWEDSPSPVRGTTRVAPAASIRLTIKPSPSNLSTARRPFPSNPPARP